MSSQADSRTERFFTEKRSPMPYLVLSLLLLLVACQQETTIAQTMEPAPTPIKTGAQHVIDSNFEAMIGKRIGLIVNHTAQVDSVHLIDWVHQSEQVTLSALFGPEHGLRGLEEAGKKVSDGFDDETGVPVYSLYGKNRKPSVEVLKKLDMLVFDIQDIGARFYTYISTMGLAMQAAAEASIPFVVLDRPNWIGGEQVSGFVTKADQTSFVGQYPIPIMHGLTVGELAEMIKGEAYLSGLNNLDLRVVPVHGWSRDLQWPDTNLPWIKTSPNIPTFETALVYPGACLIEGTTVSEGRGTYSPFLMLGAPWIDQHALADTLNTRGLPGVRFEPVAFTPKAIPGMASKPKHEGVEVHGIQYQITDRKTFDPVVAGIHVIHAFYHATPEGIDFFRSASLDRLAGTDQLRVLLESGASPDTIITTWQQELTDFLERRSVYLRY